jgi:antagonist of KipI
MPPKSKAQPVLKVLYPGILTSLQDKGRLGYQSLGIAEAGAMDTWSFVAANRLVGNADNAAALEITIIGPRLRFLAPAAFSLTGADLSAFLDGKPLEPGCAYAVKAGQELAFGRRILGARTYLAIAGGFEAPLVLSSRSTYIYAGFGGIEGRILTKGDVLASLSPKAEPATNRLPPEFLLPADGSRVLRVIMGPHEDHFTSEGLSTFLKEPYRVTPASNRMGYRLEGSKIAHRDSPIVVSESTPLGAVQVPGQGMPVLLLRERGTTGGYTKIACIITPDLDVIAQTSLGAEVHFKSVDLSEAHRLERERWEVMNKWRKPLNETSSRH